MSSYLTIFLLNWALNVLLIEFLCLRKIKPIIHVDEQRDAKYQAFRRLDVQWFTRPWLYMTCHMFVVKLVLGFGQLCICAIISNIMAIGLSKEDPIRGVRYFIMRVTLWWTATVVLFCACSNVWTYTKYSPICYKKYLGPDWEPDFNWRNAGAIIANHTSFLDVVIHSLQQLSSVMGKKQAEDIPFIGSITKVTQCLLFDRDSKQSRALVQEQISQRIREGEETDKFDPIVIFPEGGTTNGKYLINFKRGAFMGLKAVFPKIAKQHSFFQSPSSGVIEGLPHYLLCIGTPFSWLEIIHLPVFKPNDYFFAHHQKEGEEKWATFTRVVRDVMAEAGGYETLDVQIEEKFEYKNVLFPHKKQKQK